MAINFKEPYLSAEEEAKMFKEKYPLRAKIIQFIAKFLVISAKLSLFFIAFTAFYVALRWAIGVWL